MKLKNLFYVLLALPLVFAACENPKGEETKGPKLTVTSSLEVEVEAEGGTQMITYTLENAPEGAAVAATCEAAWITDITVASSIIYEVAANEGEAREATIVVSYEEQSFNVVVKQAAKPASTVLRFEVTSEPTIEFDCNAFSGSIGYILENPIEGVEVAAVSNQDWVEVTAIADGAIDFTAQANEGEAREATITISYGILDPVVITLKQAEYIDNPLTDAEFIILGVNAEATAADTWNIVFIEDASKEALGQNVFTRLTIKLAEANTLHVTDGTYTMADGSIVAHNPSADETGNSYYRYNSKGAAIADATLTVKIDKENEKASLTGHFIVGDKRYPIEWNNEVSGFMYKDISNESITEWTSFTTSYSWGDCYILKATADGVTIDLYIHELGATSSNHGTCPAAGEYIVHEWMSTTEFNYIEKEGTFGFINGHNLKSGTLTVTKNDDGTTTITFDIIDELDINWKGSYTGNL